MTSTSTPRLERQAAAAGSEAEGLQQAGFLRTVERHLLKVGGDPGVGHCRSTLP
jgi:hypothetical protein